MGIIEREGFEDLDGDSKKFIVWNFDQIQEDEILVGLINEVTDQAREWLLRNRGDLRAFLMNKMIKGATEHGAPIYSIARVEQELAGEYLDLIGWTQILKYNQRRISNK